MVILAYVKINIFKKVFKKGTCVFLLHTHLVFVTKYRRVVFVKEILIELKDIFNIVKQYIQQQRIFEET